MHIHTNQESYNHAYLCMKIYKYTKARFVTFVQTRGGFCHTPYNLNQRSVFEQTIPLFFGGHCLVIGFVDEGLNPPPLHPPPIYTQPPFPPLLLLFYHQSPFKYLTLHQPLCVVSGGSRGDTPQTTTVSQVCSECVRIGSAFRVGVHANARGICFPSSHWQIPTLTEDQRLGILFPLRGKRLKRSNHRWQLRNKASKADKLFLYYLTPVIDCCGKSFESSAFTFSLHQQLLKNERYSSD